MRLPVTGIQGVLLLYWADVIALILVVHVVTLEKTRLGNVSVGAFIY